MQFWKGGRGAGAHAATPDHPSGLMIAMNWADSVKQK